MPHVPPSPEGAPKGRVDVAQRDAIPSSLSAEGVRDVQYNGCPAWRGAQVREPLAFFFRVA